MPEYEIQVAGPIGPVAASGLPGFTFLTVPTSTILAGIAASRDDLLDVINLLNAQGLSLLDLRIDNGDTAARSIPVDHALTQHRRSYLPGNGAALARSP